MRKAQIKGPMSTFICFIKNLPIVQIYTKLQQNEIITIFISFNGLFDESNKIG